MLMYAPIFFFLMIYWSLISIGLHFNPTASDNVFIGIVVYSYLINILLSYIYKTGSEITGKQLRWNLKLCLS